MPTVHINDLRARYAAMRSKRMYLEKKCDASGGMLKNQEWWEYEYFRDPYLLGATDEGLAARFKDVFVNQIELGDNCLIGLLPVNETEFMKKFSHLIQEYNVREGGPSGEVIQAARQPLLRYFDGGPPIAKKIFDGYEKPNKDFLVKYGKREFLKPMLEKGSVRICPASYYNDVSHNAAVRDDEIARIYHFPTYQERVDGIGHIDAGGNRIEIGDKDVTLSMETDDYYLFSLCKNIYYRLPTDFDADSALIINDVDLFVQRIISAFLLLNPGWEPIHGPANYFDPYREYSAWKIPEMSKHFGYAYQREYRIVFRSPKFVSQALPIEFLDIGPMTDYAELLSA